MANQHTSPPDTMARFMQYVLVLPNGCWEWTGSKNEHGYGLFRYNGRTALAHSVSYRLHGNIIPTGLTLDHGCHRKDECYGGDECPHRRCVNPEHLSPMSNQDNAARGHRRPWNAIKAAAVAHMAITHCPQGHEYTIENTRLYRGSRFCKECTRTRNREASRQRRQRSRLQSLVGDSSK